MITSGYMIGQIIDEFALLGDKIKLRNRLGLFDLTVYVENFFRDIINTIDDFNLENLNSTRSNEPGLDLGDKGRKIAFQVTSDKSSAKIKHTLERITEEQRGDYTQFIVLIVGEKQKTYDTVVTALKNRANCESDTENKSETDAGIKPKIHPDIVFDIDRDIIDLIDIARKVVGLPLDKIQRLKRLIQEQMAKVRIELEVPDDEGNYETSGFTKWETLVEPKIGDGSKFASWEKRTNNIQHQCLERRAGEIKNATEKLSQRLYILPRITREFYTILYERATFMRKRFSEYPSLYFNTVTRSYPDARIELELLVAQELIYIDLDDDGDDHPKPGEIGLSMCNIDSEFAVNFYTYVIEENLSFRQIICNLDFSVF